MMIANKNIKIFLNRVIGPALFIWISFSIYRQIQQQPDLQQSLNYMKEAIYGEHSWKLWTAVLLMMMNWWLEARKWKILIAPVEKLSMRHSVKAVLSGLSLGLSTPNRIGEYAGRALHVSEGNRMQSVSLTVAGSFSQLLITLIFGSAGLWITQSLITEWTPVLHGMVYLITLTCGLVYFRLGWIVSIARKLRVPARWIKPVLVLENMSVTILLRVLCLSAVRYLVFLCQYILLLDLMQVHAGWWQSFWLITVLYLILAFVPTIALLDLGVRGKAGILLFQTVSTNVVGIYAASAGIWFVNLVVPALAGGMLNIRHKLFNVRR